MPRTSPAGFVVAVAFSCVLWPAPAWARPAPDPLAPTRARLNALEKCLGASDALSALRKGLLWGWQKQGSVPTLEPPRPSPPPDEYMESLDRDLNACETGAALADEEQRRAILDSVREDIAVKSDDCLRFGMGRKVPVSIKTVRGNQTENGWQVFYRWACAGPLHPEEVRVPNLTSPAHVELPPGVYSFRAERKNPAGQVESVDAVTISVGSSATVPLELPIL